MTDRSRVREALKRVSDLHRKLQGWFDYPQKPEAVVLNNLEEAARLVADPSTIILTTSELLAALSESPDVVCGKCAGFGARRCGFCENDKDGLEDFPCHDPVSCSACGGSGLNPKLVEAIANGVKRLLMEAYDIPVDEPTWVEPSDNQRAVAIAALRAFLSGGWIEGSDG